MSYGFVYFFFFQAEDGIRDGHVTGVQTCALPISRRVLQRTRLLSGAGTVRDPRPRHPAARPRTGDLPLQRLPEDRKSTRLNSSHVAISYAVFCLKKKRTATTRGESTSNTSTQPTR